MNRFIFVAVAAAAAGGIATAPAIAGLSHNPSFSHQLPVRVPSGAQTVNVDDEHPLHVHPTASPSAKDSRGPEVESRGPEAEPSDDNGVHGGALEPGDDNGHDGQVVAPATAVSSHEAEPEPEHGDDNGGSSGRQSGGHGDN